MDEDDYGALGFMFDASHARIEKVIKFDDDRVPPIRLAMIGEDPGHVQSGQYLWPAAQAAADHLIDNWHRITSQLIQPCSDSGICVVELGAGCGKSYEVSF